MSEDKVINQTDSKVVKKLYAYSTGVEAEIHGHRVFISAITFLKQEANVANYVREADYDMEFEVKNV